MRDHRHQFRARHRWRDVQLKINREGTAVRLQALHARPRVRVARCAERVSDLLDTALSSYESIPKRITPNSERGYTPHSSDDYPAWTCQRFEHNFRPRIYTDDTDNKTDLYSSVKSVAKQL